MDDTGGPPRTLLRLTALLGRRVVLADERRGRLRDLVLDLAHEPALVSAVVVRRGGRDGRAPWSGVILSRRHLLLDDLPAPVALGPHEVLARRDVLDAGVFDAGLHGGACVGEVWLALRTDGYLELAGLETGFAPVWQRLTAGFSTVEPARLLPLSQVHLTSPRAHRVQLDLPGSWVRSAPHPGLADLLTHLPVARAAEVARRLPEDRVEAAAAWMHPHPRRRLRRAMGRSGGADRRRALRTAGWRSYRHHDPDAA